MKKIIINGGKELSGTINISGAKNAAVALVPAAILAEEEVTLLNVPEISDIDSLEEILEYLGVKVKRATESMIIDPKKMKNKRIPDNIAKKLRASYYFMGALLAKYNYVEMDFPGGCDIGERPINLHLDGFRKMGATVTMEDDKYIIKADKLKGAKIVLDVASVGATINLMIAASKAHGKTIIENAAQEPEIVNMESFLNNLGANIKGAGTNTITIKGVEKLSGGFTEVIPDRIEAGTYLIAGALLGNNLKIYNVIPNHLDALTEKLLEAGCKLDVNEDSIICTKNGRLKRTKIVTYYFPGFPTDLQQPYSVFQTQCEGISTIEETIWENRYMHIPYLNEMGANITVKGEIAKVRGKTSLVGKKVKATDLRAGAALVIAGLIAKGKTTIFDAEHILRGYEGIVEKLSEVGADIKIVDE